MTPCLSALASRAIAGRVLPYESPDSTCVSRLRLSGQRPILGCRFYPISRSAFRKSSFAHAPVCQADDGDGAPCALTLQQPRRPPWQLRPRTPSTRKRMLLRFRPLPWPREKSVRPVKATWICPRQYPNSHPRTAHAEACRREAKSFLRHSPAPDPFEHRSRNPPPVRRSLRPNLAAQQAACGDGAAFASVQAFPHFRAPAIPHPRSKQRHLPQKTRANRRRRREEGKVGPSDFARPKRAA